MRDVLKPEILVIPNWNPVLSRLQLTCKTEGISITNLVKMQTTATGHGMGGWVELHAKTTALSGLAETMYTRDLYTLYSATTKPDII